MLTSRQAQIVARIAEGMSTKDIARDMGLSVRTVEAYIQAAAHRIPGQGKPREKCLLWYSTLPKRAS